jgi:hypothetical protein
MGIFKEIGNAVRNDDIKRARTAWDDGQLCFVYKPSALGSLDEDGLNHVIDGMLRVGWELRSTALAFNAAGGLDMEKGMFTFVRPSA